MQEKHLPCDYHVPYHDGLLSLSFILYRNGLLSQFDGVYHTQLPLPHNIYMYVSTVYQHFILQGYLIS